MSQSKARTGGESTSLIRQELARVATKGVMEDGLLPEAAKSRVMAQWKACSNS